MHKIDGPGHLNNAFVSEDAAAGRAPTLVTPEWLNAVQGELVALIEAAGIAPAKTSNSQLLEALRGAGVFTTPEQFDVSTKPATTAFVQRALGSYQGALTLSGDTTLVAADIGKALIWGDPTNITVTLPSLATCPKGGSLVFMNTNSANMTIQRAGTDTIDNGPTSVTSIVVPPYTSLEIITATGTSLWHVVGANALDGVSSLFGASLAGNGWQKLPSGLIIQWGGTTHTGVAVSWTFPIAFPSAARSVFCNMRTDNGSAAVLGFGSISADGSSLLGGTNTTGTHNYNWIAIGY